jgi:hypothetical protein
MRGKPNPVRPVVRVLPTEAEAGEVVVSAHVRIGRIERTKAWLKFLIGFIAR